MSARRDLTTKLRRLVERADLRKDFRLVGLELGHRLTALDAGTMGQLRQLIGRKQRQPDTFADGYLTALTDLLDAAERTTRDAQDAAEAARIAARPALRSVLEVLEGAPAGSKAIADELGKDVGLVSGWLKELVQHGMAEPFADPFDKRRRPHRLTARGQWAVDRARAATLSPAIEGAIRATVRSLAALRVGEASDDDVARVAEAEVGDAYGSQVAAVLLRDAQHAGLVERTDAPGSPWRARPLPNTDEEPVRSLAVRAILDHLRARLRSTRDQVVLFAAGQARLVDTIRLAIVEDDELWGRSRAFSHPLELEHEHETEPFEVLELEPQSTPSATRERAKQVTSLEAI